MTNSSNGIQREIKGKGQKLATITSSQYLGAVVSDQGSKPEIVSREDYASHCSSFKAGAHLEIKQNISWIKGKTDVLPCHFHISICL